MGFLKAGHYFITESSAEILITILIGQGAGNIFPNVSHNACRQGIQDSASFFALLISYLNCLNWRKITIKVACDWPKKLKKTAKLWRGGGRKREKVEGRETANAV